MGRVKFGGFVNFITRTQPNYYKKNSKLNPTLRLDQVGFGGVGCTPPVTVGDGGFEHWKSTLEPQEMKIELQNPWLSPSVLWVIINLFKIRMRQITKGLLSHNIHKILCSKSLVIVKRFPSVIIYCIWDKRLQ